MFASTRKIPYSSNIAHCVTILRDSTRRKAVVESQLSKWDVHASDWNANLTLRIKISPNPNPLITTNCKVSIPIRGSYGRDKQAGPDHIRRGFCLLKDREQLTLPENGLSESELLRVDWRIRHAGFRGGMVNVSELRVSTQNPHLRAKGSSVVLELASGSHNINECYFCGV